MDILNQTDAEKQETVYREQRLRDAVEKHKIAMRKYQAKLRAKAKLMTIEKYIDSNPDYAISYINRKYLDKITSVKQ